MSSAIERTAVPESSRLGITGHMFGTKWPFVVEPAIYKFASMLSEDYTGGYWEFYMLSGGGFYMAPDANKKFRVSSPNGYEGEMSGDALGIAACLFAYSNLSFTNDESMATNMSEKFHNLREYAMDHKEAEAIFRTID